MSRLGRSFATLGWMAAAIAGLLGLALVPALSLLVYANRLGVAVTSSLLFAEAAVGAAATLIPLADVLRARSVVAVVLAELVVAGLAAIGVLALLGAIMPSATGAVAIPAWWIALLAARQAFTAASARLALDRKDLGSGLALLYITGAAVPVVAALLTGSVTDVLVVSALAQAAVFVFVLPAVLRRSVDPDRDAQPFAWGKWLAEIAAAVPLVLAVLWFGTLALAAPLSAVSWASLLCWVPFFAVLSSDKLDRSVRMIFAPALAIAFGLVERSWAPALCQLLFPSLRVHHEWFDAIAWAGALLMLVPLAPSWQLSDSQRSRGITAVLSLAVLVVGGLVADLPGLLLGAAIARALHWRRAAPKA